MLKKQTVTRSCFVVMALMILMAIIFPLHTAIAAKKHYDNWEEVAQDMHVVFEDAIAKINNGDQKAGYAAVNSAYFDYYEVQGFEKNVMFAISKRRVSHIEAQFRDIKHILLGNKEGDSKSVIESIKDLDRKVYRDALVLDGKVGLDSPDDVGNVVFGTAVDASTNNEPVQTSNVNSIQASQASQVDDTSNKGQLVSTASAKRFSFITSFGLLLREGLEAILVCVAIIAYLVKTGNKHMCRWVYWGMLAGLLGSILLAILVNLIFGGVGQEVLEGWTMFIAVIILFWVSNWMISKSSEEAWETYIKRQVNKSIDKRSMYGLVGAAFLAVIREGAELILFYKATFTGGMTDKTYAILGFVAGIVVLVAVYCVFRFTTVRLPLKPFFFITSILLYILCISFMGKGVKELSEAGVISGGTTIPAMNGFTIDELGIYDRAETLIPQIMLLIASLWILLSNWLKSRRSKKKIEQIKTDKVAEETV